MTQPQAPTLPTFVRPSLAQLASKPPSGDRWIHEFKFDGFRLQIRVRGGAVTLLTREGADYTSQFPAVAAAVRGLGLVDAIVDGELVVENAKGISDIKQLYAARTGKRHHEFAFYAFDLLWSGDRDLRRLPLIERKTELQRLAQWTPTIRYCDHLVGDPAPMLRFAAEHGLEGIISKRADLPYRSGRGTHWVKSKFTGKQEFVVMGFEPSEKYPGSIAALAVGYHKDGELVYAGRVGTGFTVEERVALFEGLSTISIAYPEYRNVPADHVKETVWVRPMLVAEVEFRGWTADGQLWHPAFQVLRDDKPAEQVVLEEADERFSPPSP